MRQDFNHREVFARPETLGDDFTLIFSAIADAFRGMASGSRLESLSDRELAISAGVWSCAGRRHCRSIARRTPTAIRCSSRWTV